MVAVWLSHRQPYEHRHISPTADSSPPGWSGLLLCRTNEAIHSSLFAVHRPILGQPEKDCIGKVWKFSDLVYYSQKIMEVLKSL